MTKLISISRVAGRDLAYLLTILALGVLECAAWVAGLSIAASLLVLIVGIPAWLVFVNVSRRTTGLARRVSAGYRGAPIPAAYREPAGGGLLARARLVTSDPQTWRDLRWMVLNSTIGVVLASAAITVTGLAVEYIMTPAYYWALNDPGHQYVTLNFGVYSVRSVGWAFVTTGLGVALLPVALWLNHVVAAGHARLAARVLGPAARNWSPAADADRETTRAALPTVTGIV